MGGPKALVELDGEPLVRRALRVGLWASVMLGVPLTAIQLQGEQILLWLGQEPSASALAG